MPDEPEVRGLLALMLLNDARRDARFADGTVVLLRDQDRSLWDLDQIADGRAAFDRGLALGGCGSHVLQAAIAALHADEPQDWLPARGPVRRARPPHRLRRALRRKRSPGAFQAVAG